MQSGGHREKETNGQTKVANENEINLDPRSVVPR